MFNIQKQAASMTIGRKFDNVTGVVLHTGLNDNGEEITYSAGNTSGYVLDVECPIGSQLVANSILSSLRQRGFRYQPFNAEGAIIDPSCELGDNVIVNGVQSIIFSRNTQYGRLARSEIAAPHDEEVDHEFAYEPRTEREFKRESAYARSRITQTEEQISLEVVRATNAENYLGSQITITADAITAEVQRASTSEGILSTRITQNADSITSEVTRATTAEGNLNTRITQTAESITTTVAATYETKTDATSKLNEAKGYTDTREGVITASYTSAIKQSADSISLTVAGSENKYDETGVTIDYRGFGTPSTYYPAADNNGKVYLNQENGYYYLSNGSLWTLQGTLPLITTKLNTKIDQRLDSITLSVSSSSGSSTFTLKDGSTTLDTQTLNLTVQAVNVSGTLTASQIDATNLHVSAANIDGTLTASQIKVGMNDNLYDTYDSFEQVTNTTIYPRVGANADTGKSTNATLTVIDSQFAKDGAKVLSFAVDSGGTEAWSYIGYNYKDSAYLNAAYWKGFPRLSAGNYIASCYVIRANGGSNAVAKLRVLGTKVRSSAYLDSGNVTIYDTKTVTLANDLNWPETQRIEVPFTVTSTYPFAFLQLRVAPADSSAVTCYFDCLQIEKVDSGQSAGAWKPASTTTISGNSITTGTLNADLITTGTINATNVNVTNINGQNIRTGSISGGEYGAIGSGEITTWNTSGGINTGVGGGTAFIGATQSSTGAPTDFWATNLRADRVYANSYLYAASFQYGSTVLSLKTKTINGTTIKYLGYD